MGAETDHPRAYGEHQTNDLNQRLETDHPRAYGEYRGPSWNW
jgi:hypothetical protein